MTNFFPQAKQEYHENNTYQAILQHDLSFLEQSLEVAHHNTVWKKDFYLLRYGSFVALISQQPAEIALQMFSLFIDKYIVHVNQFTQLLSLISSNSHFSQWTTLLSQFEDKFTSSWNKRSSFRLYYSLALQANTNTQEFLSSHPFIENSYPILSGDDYKNVFQTACSYQSFTFIEFLIQQNPVKTLKFLAQYLNDFSISHLGTAPQVYSQYQDFFFMHCFQLSQEQFKKIQKKLHDLMKDNETYMFSRTTAPEQQQRLKKLILLMDKIKLHHRLDKTVSSQLAGNKPKL